MCLIVIVRLDSMPGLLKGPGKERGDVPITSRGLLFLAVLGHGRQHLRGRRDGCDASGAG